MELEIIGNHQNNWFKQDSPVDAYTNGWKFDKKEYLHHLTEYLSTNKMLFLY